MINDQQDWSGGGGGMESQRNLEMERELKRWYIYIMPT